MEHMPLQHGLRAQVGGDSDRDDLFQAGLLEAEVAQRPKPSRSKCSLKLWICASLLARSMGPSR